MTALSRRSFLRGIAGAVAAAIVVSAPSILRGGYPELIGDGVVDDSIALQAALDRQPFIFKGSTRFVSEFEMMVLPRGIYRTTGSIIVRSKHVTIANSRFLMPVDVPVMVRIEAGADDFSVDNCFFECKAAA